MDMSTTFIYLINSILQLDIRFSFLSSNLTSVSLPVNDVFVCIYLIFNFNLIIFQGVYVLQDNKFRLLTQISNGKQYTDAAPKVNPKGWAPPPPQKKSHVFFLLSVFGVPVHPGDVAFAP